MPSGESAGQQAQRRRAEAKRLRQQAQALNERADRIDRQAEMWSRGHAGEQTVGARLDLLRQHGYEVLHDVRWPGRRRANIDHVAIGPAGILVVDAKNWSGSVAVRDGVVRQNGYRRTRHVEGVRQAARDVAAQLQLPWALHVVPVIALAGAEAGGVHRLHDVTLVGHTDLVPWATTLPAQLTPGDVVGIVAHLRAVLPSAPAPALARGRQTGRRPPEAPREPSARERRRIAKRRAATRELLVRLVLLAILVLSAPSLLAWWNANGSDVVRSVVPVPSTAASSAAAAPAERPFANCRALRASYPPRVKRAAAKNAGPRIRRGVVIDTAAYRRNSALDADRDGIACEVPRRL